jgi:dihydrolipoamide dehydrogenase
LIAGKAAHIHFDTVPWVIYTDPEIAWVGKSEQQLKESGVAYRSGSFPFAATGRGLAMGDAAGLVKMLADEATDEVLGVHIIGPNASELIAECVVTMEFHGASEDLARIVHAHPTLSEAVHEAALHVDGRAIHRGN